MWVCTDKRGCGPHFEVYYIKLFKELLFKNSLALILSSLIMLLNAYIEIQIRKGCVSEGGGGLRSLNNYYLMLHVFLFLSLYIG